MMNRLGAAPQEMQKMQYHDVFFSRLRLLVIMAKAFLNNYPVGEHRLKAIVKNADAVAKDCVDWNGYHNNFRSSPESERLLKNDHIFFQRVKLLAIMAKSFAKGNPVGQHRKMAIQNNIDYMCEALRFVPQEESFELLKVA
jgi:hypothetical protein